MREALRSHQHAAASKPGPQTFQYTNNIAAVFEKLHATAGGLSTQEAQNRLALYGPNAPAPARRFATIRQFLGFLLNPLVIILLVASVISALLGEQLNAAIIALLVLLSVVLNFVQTYRSEQAADQLRAQVTPTATVLRDGEWTQLQRHELVPGDVIQLAAGDLIPADARLIQARDLHVQQAALTGESLPVEKVAADGPAPAQALADAPCMVLQGTSVVSGTATAVVTATGRATAFGDIVLRLAAKPPEMEFDRGIRRFSFLIMRTVIFLVLFVLVVNLAFHRPALESLLFAVALAVGLTPEFLPMITTVTLGQGALRMAKHKVIVKQLPAIQNFGSMDILCSDKTGTLTTGEMTLDQWVDPLGTASERVLLLAQLNSRYDTGIKSPLDVALLQHGQVDISDYHKLDELPFDFERRRLSIVVQHGEDRVLITKGAPESVLEVCASYEDGETQQPLGAAARKTCETTYQRLSTDGYRTLAVAYRRVPAQQQYELADEAGMTLAGYVAFVDPPVAGANEVLEALRRDGSVALALGVVLFALFQTPIGHLASVTQATPGGILMTCLRAMCEWMLVGGVLSVGLRYFTASDALLEYLNEAAYPLYVLHMPVLIFVGLGVIQSGLPTMIALTIIVVATVTLTLGLYELVIKHLGILRFLIGLKPPSQFQNVGSTGTRSMPDVGQRPDDQDDGGVAEPVVSVE